MWSFSWRGLALPCVLALAAAAFASSPQTQTPATAPAQSNEQTKPKQTAPPSAASDAGAASSVQGIDAQKPAGTQPASAASGETANDLKLGPGDLVEMKVFNLPEMNGELRVNNSGELNLPLIGRVHVAGLNTDQAQQAIEKKYLEGGYVRDPQVNLFVKEYATQGISILGEVAKPGVYPVLGSRRLFDLISAAGGTTARAGKIVSITHRDTPTATQTVTISADPALAAQANVEVRPGDTVIISKAGVVYVVGEVAKPSGFIMDNNDSLTVLQALALAGGQTRVASLDKTRLIRKGPKGLEEINVPLKQILATKAPDVAMKADDVLFIPGSAGKSAARRSLDSILQITTGLAIYGPK